jgi:DNA-binding FrmR family transcriptional regulator
MKPVINRMRRVRGQLEKLELAINQGADCEAIVPQFLAIKGATNAALAAYLKQSLTECDLSETIKRDQLITTLTRI